ncbi:MAG TPA: hypothetical protein VNJ53_07610 [Gaiellaceae bacterium]|nr:hypothetical protein [Gaiellaceae bacterium]
MNAHRSRHRAALALSGLLAVLAAALAALALAGPAAASACGDRVLADWFDNGRIDRLYPLHCYEDAIDAIPDDLRDYADAEEVISRALQSALRGKLAEGSCDPSPDGSADDCKEGGSLPPRGSNGQNGNQNGGGNPGNPGDPGGGGPQAAPNVNASGPSSVPVPLLVLGGLSLALLAAGGLGYVARRRQGVAEYDEPTIG